MPGVVIMGFHLLTKSVITLGNLSKKVVNFLPCAQHLLDPTSHLKYG
ncbi:hypothetical protein COLO4_22394 [Corchorus olitorius]|uniref:Uncharacterized protein n=1 Tax=Corchorus olitorius TaxID=93759 RepID=A0A1R3IM29_9ROSI|nr:hypothetical protein COLO4_22394 [Corchorus olitorius]